MVPLILGVHEKSLTPRVQAASVFQRLAGADSTSAQLGHWNVGAI